MNERKTSSTLLVNNKKESIAYLLEVLKRENKYCRVYLVVMRVIQVAGHGHPIILSSLAGVRTVRRDVRGLCTPAGRQTDRQMKGKCVVLCCVAWLAHEDGGAKGRTIRYNTYSFLLHLEDRAGFLVQRAHRLHVRALGYVGKEGLGKARR